jgi:hypothetical protein
MSRRTTLLFALLAALPACQSDRLVFTTYSKIGLDVSSVNGTTAGFMLGYKRFEGALIPVDMSKVSHQPSDLMPVYASLIMRNGWFQGLKVSQFFATGDAAIGIANDPEVFAEMLQESQLEQEDEP